MVGPDDSFDPVVVTGFESWPGRMLIIGVVHIQFFKLLKSMECAVLSMVLCTIKSPWSHSIRVGHSLILGLPFVVLFAWLCRISIFTHPASTVQKKNSLTVTHMLEPTDGHCQRDLLTCHANINNNNELFDIKNRLLRFYAALQWCSRSVILPYIMCWSRISSHASLKTACSPALMNLEILLSILNSRINWRRWGY